MKYFFNALILIAILNIGLFTVQAQSVDSNIKAAKGAAASGVKSDQAKLPDSLKWKKGGDVSVNFSQTYLSNWAAGGENSLSFGSTMNLFANYKKDKVIWENNAFLAYGIIKAGERKAIKNSDQINVGSRAGYQMAKNWYYSVAFLGKTQFAPGYRYTATDTTYISNFLAPAYLFLSLGLDYKPSSKFSMALSPIMGKATLVHSTDHNVMLTSGLSQDMIDKGKKSRYEFGGGIVFNLNGSFFEKRVTYITQLELFSNYLDSPQNVDVIWDFQFRVALTKFISAGVRLNMIYDDNQKTVVKEKNPDTGLMVDVTHGAKLQVKEFFEIGLFYAF